MDQAFVARTPDELRGQANKLYAIAAHVCRREVKGHLEEQAAALLAEAELRSVAKRK
jgi:hypothetical protein